MERADDAGAEPFNEPTMPENLGASEFGFKSTSLG